MSAKCSHTGNLKVYSLDVDHKKLRGSEQSINFTDSRVRCIDSDFGRECRYLCMDSDDLMTLLSTVQK